MKEVVEIVSEVQDEVNLEDVQWQPPPDFMLMNYINDASKIILPLTTTREQVVALAQWVPNYISLNNANELIWYNNSFLFTGQLFQVLFPTHNWNQKQLWPGILIWSLILSFFFIILL